MEFPVGTIGGGVGGGLAQTGEHSVTPYLQSLICKLYHLSTGTGSDMYF